MILSAVMIAGAATAGTLGASVKAYREQKRKKEYPWTVAAERMAKNKSALVRARQPKKTLFEPQRGIMARVTSSIRRVHATSQVFTQEMIAPFVSDSRNQQLQEITGTQDLGEIDVQQRAKRFYIASASLLSVSAGALLYAPLYVPGMLGVLYIYSGFLKGSIHPFLNGKRANIVDLFMTVVIAGAMTGGFFWTMSLCAWQGCANRWLLAKTKNNSRKSLVNLFGHVPQFVWVVVDGVEVELPFEKLQIGDQVVVVAGQMIPVDGTISTGMASIDQHQLTGEARLAEKSIGDEVFASTVIRSGKITVRVEKAGQDTVAAQIGQILNRTADVNLAIQSRAESFLDTVIPSVLVVSAASLPLLGLNGALALLWCVPGYRMLVLGPMTMVNYLHILSRKGILIKDGKSLEELSDIDTIVFDKTGTLTQEIPFVSQVFCNPSTPLNGKLSQEQLLTYAAAAEYRQTHPYARAILQAADEWALNIPHIDDIHYEVGYGVKVNLDGKVIRVGSERFMEMCGVTIPLEIKEEQARCHNEGYALVYVAIDEQLGGAIELQPTIRPEVKEVIRALHESGKNLYIISGDNEAPTRRLAQEVGIDHYFANTLPENKANLVKQLQEQGRSVCFVGDGINDAIALKQANVSISLRGATTIAMDTAQIVLMNGDLTQLPYLFDLSQEFNNKLDRAFMSTIIPDVVGMASTFLFGWGLLTAVLFKASLWPPQLTNVMHPLYKHRETSQPLLAS